MSYGNSEFTMRVVSSTVYLSIAFQPTSVGTRWRDCAACFGSNCGDLSFRIFSRFQITTAESKSVPSWNFTPWRSLKIQRLPSPSTGAHSVARPGLMSASASALERSQFTSAS